MRRMRIACWIPKATDTYLEYVTLIPFPRHQLLRERASVPRYTHFDCIVNALLTSVMLKWKAEKFSILLVYWGPGVA